MIYHAGHIFFVARNAYERSLKDQSEAMPSIILSTIALECFVNETIEQLNGTLPKLAGADLSTAVSWLEFAESKKSSTLEKIETFHLALTGKKADRGSQLDQDLALLYQLRNALVHRKAEQAGDWDPSDSERKYEPHRFVRLLVQRGIISSPPPNYPPLWSRFVLQHKTAKWSFNTAIAGASLASLMPQGVISEIIGIMTSHLTKIK
ncbi:MAG: hypothetical protein QM742_09055 [Aquabacterium sp.]